MTVFWNDLIKVATQSEYVDKFVGLLRLASFPVASWHSGSWQKHTVETESALLSDLGAWLRTLAKSGFIRYAGEVGDDWADLCAENVFGEKRKPSVYTQGKWRLYDTASVGPVNINPGAFWVANEDGSRKFVNVDADVMVLPLGGSVELTVQAEKPGSQYNVPADTLTKILTPQPGFEGSNLVLEATGTWITQQGADVESTPSLAQRCLDKWGILGTGSNEPAYRYRSSTGESEITKVRVYSPGGGSVRVIVAGPAGPISSAALAAAAARIEFMRPIGVPDVQTLNATVRPEPVVGTLVGPSLVDPAAAIAAAQAVVDALARETKIGARVSREKIIAALMSTGLEDLELVGPSDFQLGDSETWVPSYQLTVA